MVRVLNKKIKITNNFYKKLKINNKYDEIMHMIKKPHKYDQISLIKTIVISFNF